MDNEFIQVEFHSSLDEDSGFIFLNATITLTDIETDNVITVGSANFHIINVNLYEDWNSVVYYADTIHGDIYSIIVGLKDVIETEVDFMGLLVIMDTIKIEKEYRRKGYATTAMKEIVNYFEIWSCDYVALRPFPFEEELEKENEEIKGDLVQILVDFYKQFNFEVVQKDSDIQLILGRNLNYL